MESRMYPTPAGASERSMSGADVLAAARRDDELGIWAAGVVAAEMRSLGCEPGRRYYGVMDPQASEPLVAAVIRTTPAGGLERHDGDGGWSRVPLNMHPVGLECVVLDEPEDVMQAVAASGAGGWLLRSTSPKARAGKRALTAAASSGGSLYAVVDEFDSAAVLELIQVLPGPRVQRRENGEWVDDGAMLGRLNSVDPPPVIALDEESGADVIRQVDEYDGQAADGTAEDDPVAASGECVGCDELGVLVASPVATTRMPGDLKTYWTRGVGAAKIRWGVGGDFNRCRRQLAKYLRPDQISGACANLHKIATGTWPGKGRKH